MNKELLVVATFFKKCDTQSLWEEFLVTSMIKMVYLNFAFCQMRVPFVS